MIINKILVIRFSSIGDIILTIPVLRALRRKYPYAKLCLLVKKEFFGLTKLFPYIDRVLFLDPDDGLSGLIKLIKEINSERFDLLVDLHWNLRSMLIYFFTRVKVKVHYSKYPFRRLLRIWFKLKTVLLKHHIIELYFKPLARFNIFPDNCPPELKINNKLKEYVLNCLSELGISDKDLVIGLCPGAKWETKRLPVERFVDVGNRLMEELNAKIVIVGDSNDVTVGKKIEAWMNKKPLNLVNWTSLLELIAIIERCDILITNDSAPLHIGVALNVPTVSIFGPTTLDLGFGPYGNGKHIVLEKDLPCRPCSSHGSRRCPRKTHECMKSITTEEIISAVKHHLGLGQGDMIKI
jgi:lipopolysaccharide heptosyltransferase II